MTTTPTSATPSSPTDDPPLTPLLPERPALPSWPGFCGTVLGLACRPSRPATAAGHGGLAPRRRRPAPLALGLLPAPLPQLQWAGGRARVGRHDTRVPP